MSDLGSPAGSTGGPVTVPTLDDLPEKLRVHALARLLGRTSKEVLAALAELGIEARSAQSSVTRKNAEQVVTALLPEALAGASGAAPAAEAPAVPAPVFGAAPAAPPAAPPVAEAAPADAAAGAVAPVFAPAVPLFQPPAPAPRTRRRSRSAAAEAPEEAPADTLDGPDVPDAAAEPVEQVEAVEGDAADGADTGQDDDGEGGGRRRRRRGRRGRGRGKGSDDAADTADGEESEESEESAEDDDRADSTDSSSDESGEEQDGEDDGGDEDTEESGESGGSRRRRRRRRRRGNGEDGDEPTAGDPPNTVTRVRAPRDGDSDDGVQSVRGSTRLEAKRQRRRDGRDAGRRRVPILSEAEFLARRESVDRAMVVRERGDRVEIAVLEDEVLVEHFVTGGTEGSGSGKSIVGNIYLGRVQNVLPSMEAAFVDIGRGRNAVLYAGEVDWDAAGLGGKARRIEQALSSGDSVLVQVTKDPIGHKGARLTTQISLAGRFLVYVPSGGAAGISRKLPDVERKRLKDMLKEIVPSEAGVIIRTASEGVTQEALERDVRRLQAQWEVVKGKAEATGPSRPKAPALLYEEPDLLIKVVRDQFNEDFSKLVVAGDDAWDTVSGYVGHVAPELVERLHRHVGPSDVFAEHRIDEQLLKALDRKVWLPSGGTLVIDRTEAMTVIDVNTGKFTGSGGNLEETVTRNNLEAAEEVVRQLRLRDVGGIIVIDFIDMVLEANRDLVLRRLTECLARDRTRHQVAEVTSLGLVQMTRKRVGGGLLEHFSTTCEHCRGRGVVVNSEPVVERVETGRGPERSADREGRRSRGGRRRGGDGAGERAGGRAGDEADRAEPAVVAAATAVAEPPAATVAPTSAEHVEPAAERTVEPAVRPAAAEDGAEPVAVSVTETPAFDAARAGADLPATGNGHPGGHLNGQGGAPDAAETPAPRTRRRAVRRTAGAPSVPGGEATVAVVTVATEPGAESVTDSGTEPGTEAAARTEPDAAPDGSAPAGAAVAAQPEPTAVSRPRRTRRAASRPAGPPVVDAGEQPGGDPV